MKSMRCLYMGIFVVLLLIEIFIGTFLKGGIIRIYGGDVLVLPVLYFLVRIFWTKSSSGSCCILPAALFFIGAIAEILQAMDLVEVLGMEKDSLLGILVGSTCDPVDLICYGIGMLLIYSYVFLEKRFQKEEER